MSAIATDAQRSRTDDHKASGIEQTNWLEATDTLPDKAGVAALQLTRKDQVFGVATHCEIEFGLRDFEPEADLDAFVVRLRTGKLLWQQDYGFVTSEGYRKHLVAGGVDLDRRRRIERNRHFGRLTIHRDVSHPTSDGLADGESGLWSPEMATTNIDHKRPCPVPGCVEQLGLSMGVHLVLAHGLDSCWVQAGHGKR